MVPALALPSTGKRWLSRGVWVGLAALVSLGPGAGEPPYDHFGVAIIAIPLALRYVCGIDLQPTHLAWITVGLALHPVGAMYEFYLNYWWYDHLAHAGAATLVAAVPYVLIRADFRRLDREFRTTPLVAAAVLLWVIAGGAAWEVFELVEPNLLVFGFEDTAKDLAFNLLGGVAVLLAGDAGFRDLSRDFAARAGLYADAGRWAAAGSRRVAAAPLGVAGVLDSPDDAGPEPVDPDPVAAD